jgi:hypothetical protein
MKADVTRAATGVSVYIALVRSANDGTTKSGTDDGSNSSSIDAVVTPVSGSNVRQPSERPNAMSVSSRSPWGSCRRYQRDVVA